VSAADLVAQLAEAGTPPQLLAAVAQELFAGEAERAALASRRQNERDRKARSRDGTGQGVTGAETPAEKETSPDPLKKNTIPLAKAKALVPRRLPDDFAVPDDWKEWARETRGWSAADIATEAANFTDYWQARGSGAAKRDWRKTWQTWVRNSKRADGSHRNDRKLTPDEMRTRQIGLAELYDRMGRTDDAAEIRRKWGTGPPGAPLGDAVAGIMRKAAGGQQAGGRQ
jgi:hypothetical protein